MTSGENKGKISYYYKNDRFLDLLIATKKWRDLYNSKEAFLCVVISVIVTFLIVVIFQDADINDFLGMVRGIILVFIGGFLSLLGFLVAGLAVLANAINHRMISMIDKDNNFDALIEILFVFYFVGSIIVLTLLVIVLTYLITFLKYDGTILKVIIASMANVYLIFFSIVSSVMLTGTCLRMLILNYYYNNVKKPNDNS